MPGRLVCKEMFPFESLKVIKNFPTHFQIKQTPTRLLQTKRLEETLVKILRLLSFNNVPEGDLVWDVLMTHKDTLKLVMSLFFSDESPSSFGDIFRPQTFLPAVLLPKHHFLEHDLELELGNLGH